MIHELGLSWLLEILTQTGVSDGGGRGTSDPRGDCGGK